MTAAEKNTSIFVDTNIYLDLYHAKGRELSLLNELARIPARIISTYLVEMEFKKNRQKVIDKLHRSISRGVDASCAHIPLPFWAGPHAGALAGPGEKIKKQQQNARDSLTDEVGRMISRPAENDKVYQACRAIFEISTQNMLMKDDPDAEEIINTAREKFMRGYPPRKYKSISIVDRINWEWMLRCCKRDTKALVVVTRDTDYGLIGEKCFMNDVLVEEFQQMTGHSNICLTDRLSHGLELMGIRISEQDEQDELDLIKRSGPDRKSGIRELFSLLSRMS